MERKLPALPGGNDPASIATAALQMATYYFHDNWFAMAWQNLAKPAQRVQDLRRSVGPTPTAQANEELTRATAKRDNMWSGWYENVLRQRGIPLLRFFEERMTMDSTRAPTLVQVMRDFAGAGFEDFYPLLEGRRHPKRPMQAVHWVAAPRYKQIVDHFDNVDWHNPLAARRAFGYGDRLGVSVTI